MDLSWFITLNLLFLMGTATTVIWTSTMSPTLNFVGSALVKLLEIVILILSLS